MIRGAAALGATLVVALSCASCLHGSIYADDGAFFSSGPRLRALVYEVDGVRVLRGWYDVALEKECAFDDATSDPDPGGLYHCLTPTGSHAADVGPFLDEECTTPIAIAPPEGAVPYVVVRPPDSCRSSVAIHHAGEPVPQPVFVKSSRGCVGIRTESKFVGLGPLASESPFVTAREYLAARGGRIDAVVRIASDGSKQVVGGHDRKRNEPVRPYWTSDRVLRWLPRRVAYASGTGTSPCNGLASKIRHNAACPMTVVESVSRTGCGLTFYGIGREIAGEELASRCAQGAESSAEQYFFETAAPLPSTTFDQATETYVGSGRIRRIAYGAIGADGVVPKTLFDSATNEECAVHRATDGTLRCLPAGLGGSVFSDPACTVAATADIVSGCEPPGLRRMFRVPAGGAYAAYEIVGDRIAIYDRDATAACSEIGTGFAIREVPAAAFVPAVELRE